MKKYEKISLDRKSPQHLYLQVFEKIKNMIIDGELEQHSKLPPIRRLASFLNVNNSTIVHSYNLLEREGYVYKKVGSGTFVSPRKGKDFENEILLKKYPIDETLTGFEQEQINIREDMISFASATPTYDLFPVEDFKDLLNEVLDRDRGEVFGYHESQGYYPLRKSLANYLAEYDIDTNPDHIQIISGAQQGIDIISKAFVEYNDTVLVESPTYTGAIATFQSRGAKIVPVRILEDGIDIRLFEESIQIYRPKLCYLMPNFQNPTGYSYTKEKKLAIMEIAKKYDLLIVEDDYLSDFNFYSSDCCSLKSLDENNTIIYIKSFSKIFMPGLRLGFLVIPPKYSREILSAKHTSDISTSGLNQRVFDLYLKKGIWKKRIEYMKSIYKMRFDAMQQSLEKYLLKGTVEYIPPKGGLNFWFGLPEGYSSNQLYHEAAKENILILPGSIFFPNQKDSRYFRLSIAALDPNEIEYGIKKLSRVVDAFLKENAPKKKPRDFYMPVL